MNLIKKYVAIVKESKNTFLKIDILKFPLHNIIFRNLSFLLTPIFIILGISANQATYIRILIGLSSILLIFSGKIFIGIIIFFLGDIVDCVDGNISRIKNSATYYGKFLDGWADIVIENLLIFSLTYYYLSIINLNNIEIMLFVITIVTNLSFNLLLDRYHNFRRWVNESDININFPPVLNTKNLIIANILNDFRYLSLLFIIYDNSSKYFIFLFLFVSILYSIHKTILVLKISKKMFNKNRKSEHERK
jgi:phosphatidylglycerophosphate synthase